MIVERNQIFNLMDTNGRRSDVLNALNRANRHTVINSVL